MAQDQTQTNTISDPAAGTAPNNPEGQAPNPAVDTTTTTTIAVEEEPKSTENIETATVASMDGGEPAGPTDGTDKKFKKHHALRAVFMGVGLFIILCAIGIVVYMVMTRDSDSGSDMAEAPVGAMEDEQKMEEEATVDENTEMEEELTMEKEAMMGEESDSEGIVSEGIISLEDQTVDEAVTSQVDEIDNILEDIEALDEGDSLEDLEL